jgi:hypothetical protein
MNISLVPIYIVIFIENYLHDYINSHIFDPADVQKCIIEFGEAK